MKYSVKSILFFVVMFATVSYSFSSGKDDGNPIPAVNGSITYLEGEVTLNGDTASLGDTVRSSDIISTGEGAFCEVVFEDANVFRLDELTITQINWSESDIVIRKGGISAVFNKLDTLLQGMKDFTISTPSSVAGVRGTVFYARTEDENNTYICICNGELNLNYGGDQMDVASENHKAYRFTRKGGKVQWASAPLLYHDDPKMEALASVIDYVIPWGESKEYGY